MHTPRESLCFLFSFFVIYPRPTLDSRDTNLVFFRSVQKLEMSWATWMHGDIGENRTMRSVEFVTREEREMREFCLGKNRLDFARGLHGFSSDSST